jgi:hypothetical protein
MSRWDGRDELEEREQPGEGISDGLSRGGGDQRPRVTDVKPEETGFAANVRELVLLRERSINVRPSERATLATLGRFRVVVVEDLIKNLYGGAGPLARADFEALRRQGLIASTSMRDHWGREIRMLTLTRDGYDLARKGARTGEHIYWGFAKPAEALHDSRFYRAFCHEEHRLAAEGYRVRALKLDSELKRGYFSRLNASADKRLYPERQAESARVMHLPVINGHAVFPDFRIEYEDDRGDIGRVDVEVASDNYHDHHIATKLSAGFRVYGSAGVAKRFGISEGSLGGGRFSEERSAVLLL